MNFAVVDAVREDAMVREDMMVVEAGGRHVR